MNDNRDGAMARWREAHCSTGMLNICLALLPVLLLLCGLLLMDSFKLLRPSSLAVALAWGAVVALMNQPLDEWLLSDVGIELRTLTRYAAPVAEEILKAALIVLLLARRRIGFLIDAAVLGFAVGTGFAVVENFVFLQAMPDSPTMLWVVRGLGTATLHGATTAIAAVVAKSFQEQRKLPCRWPWPPASRRPSSSIRRTTTCCCRRWPPPSCCSSGCR